jgi:hypothetical protein
VKLARSLAVVAALACVAGCKGKPQHFSTTVEVMQVRTFGAAAGPKLTDLELKYTTCPADARQVMRVGKDFSACGTKLKVGDKLKAEVVLSWNPERGFYRNELVHLGECAVKLDPKDEANYQMVEACVESKASGVVVGVRCDRGRSPELLAACPWLRRN